MTTLANERTLSGGTSSFPQVLKLARECGATSDPVIRQRLADCYAKGQIMRYLGFRIQTALGKGMSTPESSVSKLFYAQMAREIAEVTLAVQGPRGMLLGPDAPEEGYWQQQFLTAPSLRIAAGSDEVQRNVIGERVLGLPHDVRLGQGCAVPGSHSLTPIRMGGGGSGVQSGRSLRVRRRSYPGARGRGVAGHED